jgi:3-mercaptopyruvate sulfurtransferase SseA
LALAVALTGCGAAPQEAAPVKEAPLAAVEQAAPAEAPARQVAEKPVEAAKFDLNAAVSTYLSNIPEGFMSVAKVEDFKSLLGSGEVVLVDVREAKEYGEGHFPGVINIPIRTVADHPR